MRKLIALLTIVLVFACKKAESVVQMETAAVASPAPPQAAPGNEAKALSQQALPRMIVRTADVRIVVADTSKAVDAVTKSVESQGGYVSGSQIWREGELLRAKLTLRVPAAKLTAALSAIRGVAKRVENETISSEDVSQEYVDLESQLRNLEATEIELRELMTGIRKNARKANEVLEIHQQLMAIRGEIERTRGRMRYLGQVSSFSAITLDVIPDAIAQPVVEPGWQPVVVMKNASRALIGALQGIATALIWMLIYIVPVAGIVVLVALVLWKMYRRVRNAGFQPAGPPASSRHS